MVAQSDIYTLNLPWDELPLNLLEDEQKLYFREHAQISRHTTGAVLWSSQTPGSQLLLLAGKVRLVQTKGTSALEPGKSVLLKPGDWFGDALELVGDWKARAVSQEVVVVFWQSDLWQEAASPLLDEVWADLRWRYQPLDPQLPHPAPGYPYVFSLNSAAACLTMVTQHLQTPMPLKQVQRQIRGQTAQNLVAGAETIGLQLHHIQQVSWMGLDRLSFPALLHWRQEHWVVVYEVNGDRMVMADPLNRQQRCESVPREMVEAVWDGQLWLVEPAPKAESFNLRWFIPAVWRYRKLLGEVLLASLVLQVLGLATPMLTQVIIDKVIVHESLSTLHVVAIALLGVGIFEAILGVIRLFVFTHTARRLDLSLSSQLFRHLLELPLAYFESRRVGDTVARAQELENIRQFLTGTALTVVIDAVFIVVYLGLMLFYSPKLTLVSLAVIPALVGLMLFTTPLLRSWLNESFNRHADSQSFLVETVSGIHAIKAHSAQLATRERWEGLFARYVRTNFRASTLSNVDGHVGEFLTNLSELLILWFGAMLVIEHHLTIGQLVAFQMLSGKAIAPLLHLAQLWQSFQQVSLSVDRIGDILNEAPEAASDNGLVLPPIQGQVSFDQLFFRYQPDLEDVLKGVLVDLRPGIFVGVVGRSGSGKSTLSKLIQRLYHPRSGRVLLDGFDIKGANLGSLRQQIGVVLQDDFLFNGTVFDNITFNNADIPVEQVVEAAKMAAAHDFISALPQGYETSIGERGTGLSGGQRQRLALARVLLSKAPILILDEATSALDSETERQVLQNLQRVRNGRTVLMITHRFAPLKHADQVLVLEKGVLIEQGSHQELLQQQGAYWALYQQQQAAV
ncbi:peptidase domain-containing ABC transporter [Trichocoleus sp. FACHB-262]|uniref:peptidase domain-containing ABC transporter n=1 Tax=Trichocoleus sp. FACHB-262 TaxID=2692869 RepID=UPI001681F4DB|nr:peptidase domain-containing ABC transporter [Trichocoleus sp. FACHB-262]MBD2123976.1 peptidase domain-containing ABC transporter [Trichocoleus sp. FACHB-262]